MRTQTQKRLDALLKEFEELSAQQVGYPCNQDFDYSELWPFLQYSANNVGDPFHGSSFRINTHEVEYEVINTFADMMHLSRDRAWGYVTSGGTEGNMYGLYMGREIFPDGVMYFSQDTHYSVVKIMRQQWRHEYNHQRPHSALGYRPPAPEAILTSSAPSAISVS